MKRLMCFVMMLAFVCGGTAFAGNDRYSVITMFGTEAMTASTAEFSPTLDLRSFQNVAGFFSLQVFLDDDDGSVTLEWETSNDNTNWVEPLDANGVRVPDILTSFAFNGGPGADGREYTPVPKPIMGRYVRIKATPGAQNLTALTVLMAIN